MKKAVAILVCTLLVLTLILPVGAITCSLFGYRFELIGIPAFSVIIVLLSLSCVGLGLKYKDSFEPLATRILICVSMPISVINTLLFITQCNTLSVIICTSISVACCLFMIVRFGKTVVIKSIALLSTAYMIVPLLFLGMFVSVFQFSSESVVIKTVTSPNGKHYAEVIASNQGALGGDTFVNIREEELDLIVFKISKKSQRVYSGDWDEQYKINIKWESDNCLIINSREYWIK